MSLTYISHINALIRARVERTPKLVCYGQNITAGSCLSGLTRDLKPGPESRVINTQNSEYTLIGLGFGLMMRGVSGIYFMKQQDFLLFGLDHLVNTWNVVRTLNPSASYTALSIVVDSGYEGPQSRLNNFADFCSMARVQGYAITNHDDAAIVLDRHLVAPGFRMIGVSQRLFRETPLQFDGAAAADPAGTVVRYAGGTEATIVCFNFSLPQGAELHRRLVTSGISASLFSAPGMLIDDWSAILADVGRTRRLVILDDSRSSHKTSQQLELAARRAGAADTIVVRERSAADQVFAPNADTFTVDAGGVARELGRKA